MAEAGEAEAAEQTPVKVNFELASGGECICFQCQKSIPTKRRHSLWEENNTVSSYGQVVQDAFDLKLSRKTHFPKICQGCFLIAKNFLKKKTELMENIQNGKDLLKKSYLIKRVKRGSKDQEGQEGKASVSRKKKLEFVAEEVKNKSTGAEKKELIETKAAKPIVKTTSLDVSTFFKKPISTIDIQFFVEIF